MAGPVAAEPAFRLHEPWSMLQDALSALSVVAQIDRGGASFGDDQ